MSHQPATEERAVHRQRQQHPEHQLDRHRHARDDQRVRQVAPPRGRGEHGGVVGQADPGVVIREAQVRAQQRQVNRVADRVRGHRQHHERGGSAQQPPEPPLVAGSAAQHTAFACHQQPLRLERVLELVAQVRDEAAELDVRGRRHGRGDRQRDVLVGGSLRSHRAGLDLPADQIPERVRLAEARLVVQARQGRRQPALDRRLALVLRIAQAGGGLERLDRMLRVRADAPVDTADRRLDRLARVDLGIRSPRRAA